MEFLKGAATEFKALTEQSEAEWQSDYHLLRTTAGLMGTTPHALLGKISANTGDSLSLRNLQNGQRLPIMSRAQLWRILEKRMRTEKKIIENACRDSQTLASRILPLFLLFGVAALLLV